MTRPASPLREFPAPRPARRPFTVPEAYRRLFAQDRLPYVMLPVGRPAYLVGRYADVRTVLAGQVSADGRRDGFPMARPGSGSSSSTLSFFRMDGADHRRYRKLVTRDFSLASVASLRPVVERIADELVDEMAGRGGPLDLVAELALPVPSRIICQILGVPYADRAHFHRLSDVLARGSERGPEAFTAAVGELLSYVASLAQSKRGSGGADLLSGLAAAFDRDGELDSRQLAPIVLLLLVAAHETTASMIALGLLALMTEPGSESGQALRDEPGLLPGAVEELLRYLSVAQWVPRIAEVDLPVGDRVIPAGAGVLALPLVANRDPEVFPDPDRLDIRRDNAGRHLAFGFGPHQCLGLQLARMELEVVYGTVLRRLPPLRPAVPVERLRFRQRSPILGIEELPTTW